MERNLAALSLSMKLQQSTPIWIWVLLAIIIASSASAGEPGNRAPSFTLRDLSGHPRSLSHYPGKLVVLDFWATWCAPCRATIPELLKLQEKHADKGVVILGISLDDPQLVSDDAIRAFVNKHAMNYPILRADAKLIQDYFGREPPLIPAAFIVDRQGRLAGKISGYRPGAIEETLFNILGSETRKKTPPSKRR
jgi:thiol-disulfide isomerase/thioredoxin